MGQVFHEIEDGFGLTGAGEVDTALVERRRRETTFPASYLFPGPGVLIKDGSRKPGGNAHSSIRRWLPEVVRAAGMTWGKYRRDDDGDLLLDRRGRKLLDPDGVTFHTFRHSMASNAFAAGIPDSVIRKLGNWKDGKMLDRYRHLAQDEVAEAAGKVASFVARGHTTVTNPEVEKSETGKSLKTWSRRAESNR